MWRGSGGDNEVDGDGGVGFSHGGNGVDELVVGDGVGVSHGG